MPLSRYIRKLEQPQFTNHIYHNKNYEKLRGDDTVESGRGRQKVDESENTTYEKIDWNQSCSIAWFICLRLHWLDGCRQYIHRHMDEQICFQELIPQIGYCFWGVVHKFQQRIGFCNDNETILLTHTYGRWSVDERDSKGVGKKLTPLGIVCCQQLSVILSSNSGQFNGILGSYSWNFGHRHCIIIDYTLKGFLTFSHGTGSKRAQRRIFHVT